MLHYLVVKYSIAMNAMVRANR